jgi:hypothetical protein
VTISKTSHNKRRGNEHADLTKRGTRCAVICAGLRNSNVELAQCIEREEEDSAGAQAGRAGRRVRPVKLSSRAREEPHIGGEMPSRPTEITAVSSVPSSFLAAPATYHARCEPVSVYHRTSLRHAVLAQNLKISVTAVRSWTGVRAGKLSPKRLVAHSDGADRRLPGRQ